MALTKTSFKPNNRVNPGGNTKETEKLATQIREAVLRFAADKLALANELESIYGSSTSSKQEFLKLLSRYMPVEEPSVNVPELHIHLEKPEQVDSTLKFSIPSTEEEK